MKNAPVLVVEDLYKSYDGMYVLNGVNLKVSSGEIIGYIGPNGAGKSTTVKVMLGLTEDYTGRITIFNQDIASGDVAYKRRIGYVPETAELYDSLTAFEYLRFVGQLYGLQEDPVTSKAKKLLELFGLDEDVLHSRISSYSKGMRQKVLIVSSLLHNPDLLFFDEPISGLDANSVMIFKEILSALASQGKTIFYSSHIMDVVEKISHRIILLNEGRIVADGSFEALQAKGQQGSLEEIFNQLTGFDRHRDIAQDFVAVVQEV
ncbi:ABC transporter ATP-binding protein [Pullulanibacillus camelliae]|uniref:ABC transporter ATP-binding protein n=1 Tax=Pullulanibacillus camelliae TaxID=1707096 RepID=A0A8J2YIL6_9BACL|nr:ABC transporter ATP-binding protein [Pullulanibacillus camelliae]GGE44766.1 ABC transporter ATP-binding protein [Pullulanibacillus camelliae]